MKKLLLALFIIASVSATTAYAHHDEVTQPSTTKKAVNTAPTNTTVVLPLVLGSNNGEVLNVQQSLVELGFLKTQPTGYFGQLTKKAVQSFQMSQGIGSSGSVSDKVRIFINQEIAKINIAALAKRNNRIASSSASGSVLGVITGSKPTSLTITSYVDTIASGKDFLLNWKAVNLSNCFASGNWSGSLAKTGSKVVTAGSPGMYFYKITCNRGSLYKTETAVVEVTGSIDGTPPPPTPAPTVALTATPMAVTSGTNATLKWSTTNATSCTASGTGFSGVYPINGQETISNITSSQTFTLTCTGTGGTATGSVTVTVASVQVPPPTPAPTASLTAAPMSVASGATTVLTWSSTNATSCTGSGSGFSGAQSLSGQKTSGSMTSSQTFSLTCTGSGGTVTSSVAVTVSAPTTTILSGVVSEGDSISVFWSGNHPGIYASTNPTVLFRGFAVGGSGIGALVSRQLAVLNAKPKVFTVLIGANDLMSYSSDTAFTNALFAYTDTIRATGAKVAVATILPQANATTFNTRRAAANSLIRSAVGSRIDAVIDFAADPTMGPDSAALNTTLYRDGVHPTDGTQGVGEGGQMKLSRVYAPVVNALLSGTAVPPPTPVPSPAPTVTLSATPMSVASGGKTVLTWTSTNATSCTGSGTGFTGAQPLNAQETISNLTSAQTFSLTCTGSGGTVKSSVTVTVSSTQVPPPTPLPTLTLTANPTTVSSGQSTTVTWSTTNATSCTGTGQLILGAQPTSSTITLSNMTSTQTISLTCTGAGGSVSKLVTVTVTGTVISPPPPPPPSGINLGLPSISSNFDINAELVPAQGTGAIPGSGGAPNVGNVGAFRFICNPSHEAFDDPIVYPGQPGKSHLHQFFGNTLVNANSTYSTLRTTGMSTCNSPLNRSGYWVPAMIDGNGMVVRPDYISVYYKRVPTTDPLCTKGATACVDLPRGLVYVFGNAKASSTTASGAYFNCDTGTTAIPGYYSDIATAAKNCPLGLSQNKYNTRTVELVPNQLGAITSSPDCWNGKDLDSPDHRSHVAFSQYIGNSYANCPSTHPYLIPQFTMGVWYNANTTTLNRSGTWTPGQKTWHLSSDESFTAPYDVIKNPGASFHGDWFGAWDDTVKAMWEQNCIEKLLNCSGGDLGNGKQLKMFSGFRWSANPQLVAQPPHP